MKYDLLIKNVRVVRPGESSPRESDIGISHEKFARVARICARSFATSSETF